MVLLLLLLLLILPRYITYFNQSNKSFNAFLQDDPVVPEFQRIKEFIVKNKMITKNVEKVKERINKVVIECERKGKNSPNLDKRINVFLQVFRNINKNIQTTNIPNIKFRTFAISEINRLINLCENVSE